MRFLILSPHINSSSDGSATSTGMRAEEKKLCDELEKLQRKATEKPDSFFLLRMLQGLEHLYYQNHYVQVFDLCQGNLQDAQRKYSRLVGQKAHLPSGVL